MTDRLGVRAFVRHRGYVLGVGWLARGSWDKRAEAHEAGHVLDLARATGDPDLTLTWWEGRLAGTRWVLAWQGTWLVLTLAQGLAGALLLWRGSVAAGVSLLWLGSWALLFAWTPAVVCAAGLRADRLACARQADPSG